MIAEAAIKIPKRIATVVATTGKKIVSNTDLDKSDIELCKHEEADTSYTF